MRLIAVIGTACDIDFDMIMAGENERFNFPGQLKGVAVAAYTVVIAHAGGDVTGADGGIASLRIPLLGLSGNRVHIHVTQRGIHLFYVILQIGVDRRNILVPDSRNIKGLAGAEMEIAVTPGVGDVFHRAEVLRIDHPAGHTHLQHEFPRNL